MSTAAVRNTESGGRWSMGLTVVALISLAVLILGLVRQVSPQPFQAPDFRNTYRAAEALRDGNDLYAPAIAWVSTYKRGQPLTDQYFYAPTYALLLTPLTLLPYQTAIAVWGGFLLTFLCLAIYALFRSTGPPVSLALVFGVAALASLMSAVRAEYFLGQANLFMLACISVAIWARLSGRPVLAGILLALALVTKPMLLLMTGFLLWKREFTFAFTTIAGFFVLLLAPFLWLGGEALADLLTLWQFYSSQYLSFSENITPRGMFERLFTVNPFVTPLIEMPILARVLWLVVVVIVFVLLLAIIEPRPMRRDGRTLIEMGAILSGLMLVSPLTEPPYLVLLILPLVATLIYLRGVERGGPPYIWIAIALCGIWFMELVPRSFVEPFFWANLSKTDRFQSALLVFLAPTHFYILLATFLLQVYVLRLESGTSVIAAVQRFVRNSPMLIADLLKDLVGVRTVARRQP
jgi:hypothetical protein